MPGADRPVLLVGATTYEPGPHVARALCTRLSAFGAVAMAVVDNSTTAASRDTVAGECAAAGILHVGDGTNRGTAGALNVLLRLAAARQIAWVLYFDQDSLIDEGHGECAVAAVAWAAAHRDVAAIGSVLQLAGHPVPADGGDRFVPVRYVTASGTMFRVDAVAAAGGFDEQMFLDVVDHEISLRLRSRGCRVVIDRHRVLQHEIGRNGRWVARPMPMLVTEHPLWRREMMWRNSVALVRRYARTFPIDCAKHVVVRVVETAVAAVVFRKWAYVTAAARGTVAGIRRRWTAPMFDLLSPTAPVPGDGER